MKYEGLLDDGTWQPFEADTPEDATPEATGYKDTRPLEN
jgi:hypothetical protein